MLMVSALLSKELRCNIDGGLS